MEEAPWWSAYGQLLVTFSSAFDNFFGNKLFSSRSFRRCLALAFIYSFTTLLIHIGFTSSRASDSSRIGILGGVGELLLVAFVLFLAVKISRRWEPLRKLISLPSQWHRASPPYYKYFIAGMLANLVFVSGSLGAALADSGFNAGIGAGITFGLGIVFAWITAEFGIYAGILFGMGLVFWSGVDLMRGVVFAVWRSVDAPPTLLEAVLAYYIRVPAGRGAILVGLPIINAAFDWPSWGVTRWLMSRLKLDAERGSWPAIAFHVALDFVLAIFFLIMLTAILATVFNLIDLHQHYPVKDLVRSAQLQPLGEGFWVTMMLLSTLFPTAVHLAAAIGALMVVPPPLRRIALYYLEDADPSISERWIAAGYLTAWVLVAVSVAIVMLIGIVFGLSYHGHTLWTLVFYLADFLVVAI